MLQGCVPWPDEFARRHVDAGLWEGLTVADGRAIGAPAPQKAAVVAMPESGLRRISSRLNRPDFRGPAPQECVQQKVLRNTFCCLKIERMPVAVAQKVKTLSVDFRSSARLADLLGVSRSQVTRWLRGAGIDPLNAEKVDLLELVWSNVLRIYEQDAALAWLFGVNPLLGDRRPVDLIRQGRTEELMRAVRAERSDTFR
jgi:uncharacterized protein (DUF2384 family)